LLSKLEDLQVESREHFGESTWSFEWVSGLMDEPDECTKTSLLRPKAV